MFRSFAIIVSVVFSLLIFFAADAAEKCSIDKLIGSCGAMKKLGVDVNGSKQLGLPKFKDGSTIYNDQGMPRAKKSDAKPPSPFQKKRALEVSERIRSAAIQSVIGDTQSALLTSEQKAMVARLKSVRVMMSAGGPNDNCNSSPVSQIDPNASYSTWTHSLVICPPAAKLAPAAFTMLMAHEFGHVISPCAMSRDQYSVKAKKIASSQTIRKCLGGSRDVEFAQTMFPNGATQSNLSSLNNLAPKYRKVVGKLVECGALSKNSEESGLNESKVFENLSGCLSKAYAKNHKNFLKASASKGRRENPSGPPADAKSMKCMGIYEEHFAEAVGSKVFASMLKSDSGAKESARVGLVQMSGYACTEKSRPKEDPAKMFQYPRSVDRVDIQMADTAMQSALGCEMPNAKVCVVDGSHAQGRNTENAGVTK